MSDLIDRQKAIEALDFNIVHMTVFSNDEKNGTNPFAKYNKGLEDGIEALKALPSAETEPKWIPVSEALPEEEKDVLLLMAEGEMAVGQRRGVNYWDGYRRRAVIVAWMPLPEPLRGEE